MWFTVVRSLFIFRDSGEDSFVLGKKFLIFLPIWDVGSLHGVVQTGSSGLDILSLHVDSFNIAMQFPMLVCEILVFLLSFRYFKTVGLFLDHATPLYPQKLAVTSPTSGGRLVGIVRSRTQATKLVRFIPSYIRCENCLFSKHNRFLQQHFTPVTGERGEFWPCRFSRLCRVQIRHPVCCLYLVHTLSYVYIYYHMSVLLSGSRG
jgi:hypothetical protein